MTCQDEPETPALPGPGVERDRIAADWILALIEAGGDCRANLAGVRAWAEAVSD